MKFKPGDILYRKYSDKNDLYCIIAITDGPFNVGQNVKFVYLYGHYTTHSPSNISSELSDAIESWYVKVDLNNYDIKDKFLKKLKGFLEEHLGKIIHYNILLDNLLYIEILDTLKKYEIKETTESNQ